jgi:hypothetical protein
MTQREGINTDHLKQIKGVVQSYLVALGAVVNQIVAARPARFLVVGLNPTLHVNSKMRYTPKYVQIIIVFDK